jgi:peptidoglycan hydrolase-like protein with peptidoglycan-binding domain
MTILVFLVAIAISAVAAYYSIVGLVTIFAASVIPVAIMGTVLEIGKLVTATWLYRNWKEISWWLKTYLTTAVVVLMLITSMGIFGFLSKAHIEQTAKAEQNQSLIVRISEQIEDSEERIEKLQNEGIVANEQQNAQIVQNEKQIEQINARYAELIDEQNSYISQASRKLELLDKYIEENDVERIQALVGAKVDGQYGSGTARRVEAFRKNEQEASRLIVQEARGRIAELRQLQLSEVSALTEANGRLQAEIGKVVVDTEQISQLENQILELNNQKFELETDFRKLEAEFGPVKYISELIYDDKAEENLDDAVRIVILMLIFVFDPLAVLLLIASNHGYVRRKDDENNRPEDGESKPQVNQIVPEARQEEAVEAPHEDDKVVVTEEKVVRVKDADVEVKYDKENDEFQFIEATSDVRDDRGYPDLRAKKEQ